jgi:hypothetical protein
MEYERRYAEWLLRHPDLGPAAHLKSVPGQARTPCAIRSSPATDRARWRDPAQASPSPARRNAAMTGSRATSASASRAATSASVPPAGARSAHATTSPSSVRAGSPCCASQASIAVMLPMTRRAERPGRQRGGHVARRAVQPAAGQRTGGGRQALVARQHGQAQCVVERGFAQHRRCLAGTEPAGEAEIRVDGQFDATRSGRQPDGAARAVERHAFDRRPPLAPDMHRHLQRKGGRRLPQGQRQSVAVRGQPLR